MDHGKENGGRISEPVSDSERKKKDFLRRELWNKHIGISEGEGLLKTWSKRLKLYRARLIWPDPACKDLFDWISRHRLFLVLIHAQDASDLEEIGLALALVRESNINVKIGVIMRGMGGARPNDIQEYNKRLNELEESGVFITRKLDDDELEGALLRMLGYQD